MVRRVKGTMMKPLSDIDAFIDKARILQIRSGDAQGSFDEYAEMQPGNIFAQ
jgi:hypothetical protein